MCYPKFDSTAEWILLHLILWSTAKREGRQFRDIIYPDLQPFNLETQLGILDYRKTVPSY